MAQPSPLLCVIVGKDDFPIYEADLTSKNVETARDERPQYLYHFVLHAALDALDEAEWTTSAMHLGVIDRFNNLQVSAFTTAARVRILLLHDGRPDEYIKFFFKGVHELYLKEALNPFFIPTARITSPEFNSKLRQLARVYFK